jgi:ribonuclease P protein component
MAGGIAAKTRHFALHRLSLATAGTDPNFDRVGTCLGAVIPKRWAKRAVTRNMIKRQIFTLMARSHIDMPPPSPGVAYVVRLRAEFDKSHFKSASSDLLKVAVRDELVQLVDAVRHLGRGAPA